MCSFSKSWIYVDGPSVWPCNVPCVKPSRIRVPAGIENGRMDDFPSKLELQVEKLAAAIVCESCQHWHHHLPTSKTGWRPSTKSCRFHTSDVVVLLVLVIGLKEAPHCAFAKVQASHRCVTWLHPCVWIWPSEVIKTKLCQIVLTGVLSYSASHHQEASTLSFYP